MALASLLIKLLFAAAVLAGAWWLASSLRSQRDAKARPHRMGGGDRRARSEPVAQDRRHGPRRTEDVAEGFLKELDGG